MIDILRNTYFYLLISIIYIVLSLFILYRLKVFSYINRLKFTDFIKSKIISIKSIVNLNKFLKNKVIIPLNIILSNFKNWFYIPTINKTSFALGLISDKIYIAELKSSHEISHGFTEVITYMSLVFRKAVETEIQIIWSIFLVFIVLIYFILTMQ